MKPIQVLKTLVHHKTIKGLLCRLVSWYKQKGELKRQFFDVDGFALFLLAGRDGRR
jgi:hypothetical protein